MAWAHNVASEVRALFSEAQRRRGTREYAVDLTPDAVEPTVQDRQPRPATNRRRIVAPRAA